jgi:hypothetical protein
MMKGIDCLLQLPYKMQVQILKNMANQDINISDKLLYGFDDVAHFIIAGFGWNDTPEGHLYWVRMHSKYQKLNS